MKSVMFAVAVLFALIAFADGPQQPPKSDTQLLDTHPDPFGARPGSFHFLTNEQSNADAAQLKLALAALERLESSATKLDPRTRDQFTSDLKTLRALATSFQERRTAPAGETAAQVEQRLNAAKGQFMCGACHGHGMMHGGGMRGPMGGRNQ